MRTFKIAVLLIFLSLGSSCAANKKVVKPNPVDFSVKQPDKFNYQLWPKRDFDEKMLGISLVKNVRPEYLRALNEISKEEEEYEQWLDRVFKEHSSRPKAILEELRNHNVPLASPIYQAEDLIGLRGQVFSNPENEDSTEQGIVVFDQDHQTKLLLIITEDFRIDDSRILLVFYWEGGQLILVPLEITKLGLTATLSKYLYEHTGRLLVF